MKKFYSNGIEVVAVEVVAVCPETYVLKNSDGREVWDYKIDGQYQYRDTWEEARQDLIIRLRADRQAAADLVTHYTDAIAAAIAAEEPQS